MKKMIFMALLSAGMLFGTSVNAQVTFNGNGNSGFGGPIGGSSMVWSDDGETITVNFTKGAGDFNDAMVIYIANGTSGRGAIDGNVNDQGDPLRRAISSAGDNSSTITLPLGFEATHAIGINTGFGGLWSIPNSGNIENNGLSFVSSVNTSFQSTDATFTFNFTWANLGLSSGDPIRFVATYLNAGNGFTSDEGYGSGISSGNPGSNAITFTSYFEYPSGVEVSNNKSANLTEETANWRLLSSPSAVPFNTWLSGIWTQGGTGANFEGGSSNVFTSNGSDNILLDRVNITDFTQNVQAGRGYAVYVYESDFGGARAEWPKVLTVTGAENAAPVAFEIAEQSSEMNFALAGNPFASTIQFDDLTRSTHILDKVWVYNPATDAYIARAGGVGDFDGLVTPFQGFWVEFGASNETSTLTFPASAKSSGGTFYAKTTAQPRLVLDFTDGTFSNSAWISFSEDAALGKDPLDAVQFSGMSGVGAQLFTVVDGVATDINFLPFDIEEVVEFPLGYYSSIGGELTLSVRDLNLPGNLVASIINTSTGETFDLDNGTEIRFNAPRSKQRTSDENSLITSATSSEFKIRLTPPTSTSSEIVSELPTELTLAQNFPNPFNPTTTIRYNVPENTHVRLAVYNTLGQQVAVLVDGAMSAGAHTATFDASSLSSGVYVYRIEAAGQVLSKRMTLMK